MLRQFKKHWQKEINSHIYWVFEIRMSNYFPKATKIHFSITQSRWYFFKVTVNCRQWTYCKVDWNTIGVIKIVIISTECLNYVFYPHFSYLSVCFSSNFLLDILISYFVLKKFANPFVKLKCLHKLAVPKAPNTNQEVERKVPIFYHIYGRWLVTNLEWHNEQLRKLLSEVEWLPEKCQQFFWVLEKRHRFC